MTNVLGLLTAVFRSPLADGATLGERNIHFEPRRFDDAALQIRENHG